MVRTNLLKKGIIVCLAGSLMFSAMACGKSNSTTETKTETTSNKKTGTDQKTITGKISGTTQSKTIQKK